MATLIVGGAVTGGVWITGLSVLARGRRPQMFVLGSDGWQVVLLEHGTARVILLLGEFERSPEGEIDLLCGLLRQHIDVVVGDGPSLRLLSSTFRARRAVSTFIETGARDEVGASPGYRRLPESIGIEAGDFTLEIEPLPEGEWIGGEARRRNWIAHASIGRFVIALAPDIDTIAGYGDPDAALAVAPRGDIGRLWRFAPGCAVATNSREMVAVHESTSSPGLRRSLVRTFPRDIAAFVVRGDRLSLPDWVEHAPPQAGS